MKKAWPFIVWVDHLARPLRDQVYKRLQDLIAAKQQERTRLLFRIWNQTVDAVSSRVRTAELPRTYFRTSAVYHPPRKQKP